MSAPLDEVIENVPYKLIDMNEALRLVKGKALFTGSLIDSMKTSPVTAPKPSLQPELDKARKSNIELLEQQISDSLKLQSVINHFIQRQATALMTQDVSLLADLLGECTKLSAVCREGKALLDGLEAQKKASEIDPLADMFEEFGRAARRNDVPN